MGPSREERRLISWAQDDHLRQGLSLRIDKGTLFFKNRMELIFLRQVTRKENFLYDM